MNTILEARNIDYNYGDGTGALHNVSVAIEEGKKIALVGPNGAGKSTLMLLFNGILRPANGEILFRGKPLGYDSRSLRELRRLVSIVFQNSDDQLFAPTVFQDVAFGPQNLGYPSEKVNRYVNYALQYVGLSGYERRPPHHLSGGEKKRAAIAGILAMEPIVMILDEPTSNLDPASSEEIMDMLDELNSGGKTIIISTHDVDLAYRWADDVILMKDGVVIHRGNGPGVFGDEQLIKNSRLKLPIVVDIYLELVERGLIIESKPPRSILELCNQLETNESRKAASFIPGKIFICDVDSAEKESLSVQKTRLCVDFIGAMGTSAKLLAKQMNISLDFTYGVIDKCILKSLVGKSSLIMTSSEMKNHILKRINDYSQESRVKIDSIVI